SRPPATFATVAARATSTGTAPPRRANCSTYPPTVLTRPCPPTAQYRLTSAYANATTAAAYAAAVPTADQREAAGAGSARSKLVLPITVQYRQADRESRRPGPVGSNRSSDASAQPWAVGAVSSSWTPSGSSNGSTS